MKFLYNLVLSSLVFSMSLYAEASYSDLDLSYYGGISPQMTKSYSLVEKSYNYICSGSDISSDECVLAKDLMVTVPRSDGKFIKELITLSEVLYHLEMVDYALSDSYVDSRVSEYDFISSEYVRSLNSVRNEMDREAENLTDVAYPRQIVDAFDSAINSFDVSTGSGINSAIFLSLHAEAMFDAIESGRFSSFSNRSMQKRNVAELLNIDYFVERAVRKVNDARGAISSVVSEGVDVSVANVKIKRIDDLLETVESYVSSGDRVTAMRIIQDVVKLANGISNGVYWDNSYMDMPDSVVTSYFPKYFFRDVPADEENEFAYYLQNIENLSDKIVDREILLNLKPGIRKGILSARKKSFDSNDYLLRHLHRVSEIVAKGYVEDRLELFSRIKLVDESMDGLLHDEVIEPSVLEYYISVMSPIPEEYYVSDSAREMFALLRSMRIELLDSESSDEVLEVISKYKNSFEVVRDSSISERVSKKYIPFKDVSERGWQIEYVKDLYDAGIVNGYADNSFKPENDVSRAELLKMALVAFDHDIEKVDSSFGYPDVVNNTWHSGVVSKVIDLGIYDFGDGSSHFKPNERISRVEALRAIVLISGGVVSESDKSSFLDVEEQWHIDFVNYAKDSDIVSGFSDGTFRPLASITRAEMSKIISKLR